MAESFFVSFKREVVDGEHFATRAEARAEIFGWCVWYNATGLHTSIGKRPPIEFEATSPTSHSQHEPCPAGGGMLVRFP
jgi:transposase InsO family protein